MEPFVEIEPKRVQLTGVLGKTVTSEIRIVPRAEYPFKITRVKALKGEDFTWKLNTVTENDQTVYTISLEATRETVGRFYDTLMIATDSDIKKEIQLRVFGNIYEAAGS